MPQDEIVRVMDRAGRIHRCRLSALHYAMSHGYRVVDDKEIKEARKRAAADADEGDVVTPDGDETIPNLPKGVKVLDANAVSEEAVQDTIDRTKGEKTKPGPKVKPPEHVSAKMVGGF